MELLLIRHALPVRRENVDGPADPILSDVGRAQAERLADYLSAEVVHALYTSPLKRAVQTAEPLAARRGLAVVLEDGVAEYDRHSDWYVPAEELKAQNDPRWRQIIDGTIGYDNGMTAEQFRRDVVDAIERLVARHPGEKIAIVCHGGVINAYVGHVLGLDDANGFFYPNYTSIHRIVAARSGERTVLTLNETAHLRGSGLPMGIHG